MKNSKRKLKTIPQFKNEEEECEFWMNHDTAEYVDWSKADEVQFPDLKPTTKTISIRLPEQVINGYKRHANKMDIPYQTLMKTILSNNLYKMDIDL